MHIVTTTGPDNATKAVLPFIAAKGAQANGEDVAMFLMQEAAYLASERHADLAELKAPGLPTVADALDTLREGDALEEVVVCEPCAAARNVTEEDLRGVAEFGEAPRLAEQAAAHGTTTTF